MNKWSSATRTVIDFFTELEVWRIFQRYFVETTGETNMTKRLMILKPFIVATRISMPL
jgi:hypothetical protein